jgi:anti-sigma regulatory factor (Ser/Thr protein kinase)
VPAWWLLCPYDTSALGGQVLEEARRSHPFVSQHGVAIASGDYRGLDRAAGPFAAPLPDPPGRPPELRFGPGSPGRLRALVARYGAMAGLGEARTADLVLAVDEIATNSLRHGGGRRTLRTWREDGAVVCEVRDAGRIEDPMAGRERPAPDGDGGRGLWMVNQLCDLVQLRTFPTGAVVRLHLYVAEQTATPPVYGWGRRRRRVLLGLDRPHVGGLGALGALGHVELDGLALVQRAVAARLDGAEVHEDVLAGLRLDEAVALVGVEPLHGSNSHGCLSLPPSTRR